MRRTKTPVGTAAGAALALGGMVLPAQATAATTTPAPATVQAAADVAPLALPNCLDTRTWDNWHHAYVEIHNTCGTTQKFKVRWEGAADSGCITLAPGKKKTPAERRTFLHEPGG